MLPLLGWPPRCLLRAATGVPCPFCGMTTGVLAALSGHPGAAVAANPAAPLFVVGVALAALSTAFGGFGGPWRAELAQRVGGLRRWRWPAVAALWAFQLHRVVLR